MYLEFIIVINGIGLISRGHILTISPTIFYQMDAPYTIKLRLTMKFYHMGVISGIEGRNFFFIFKENCLCHSIYDGVLISSR
jgi:hypothetical protein